VIAETIDYLFLDGPASSEGVDRDLVFLAGAIQPPDGLRPQLQGPRHGEEAEVAAAVLQVQPVAAAFGMQCHRSEPTGIPKGDRIIR
jgi:hypothetical protein